MFHMPTTHRRRRTATGRSPKICRNTLRWLRVESMEGRLMLSAAADDFMPLHLNMADFGLETVTSYVSADYASPRTGSANEGGYIATPSSPAGGGFDTDVSQGPEPEESLPDQVSPGPLSGNTTSNSNNSTNSTELDTGSAGIRPSVIPIWNVARLNNSSIGPILSVYEAEQSVRDEGGTIAIESILADTDSRVGPELDEGTGTNLAAATADKSPAPSQLAAISASADSEISGEWARAMAFEMVGGEPTETERNAEHDAEETRPTTGGEPKLNYLEPVSANGARNSTGDAIQERIAVDPARHDTASSHSNGVARSLKSFATGGDHGDDRVDDEIALSLPHLAEHAGGGAIMNVLGPVDSARANVFGRLGDDENAASLPLAFDLSWRGALNATPLLMMLALERIAASNSRRINRHNSFVSAFRTRRRNLLKGGEQLA